MDAASPLHGNDQIKRIMELDPWAEPLAHTDRAAEPMQEAPHPAGAEHH